MKTAVESLGLREVFGLRDLTRLAFLSNPRALGVTSCPVLADVRELVRWSDSLRMLWLRECPLADLAPLAWLDNLEFLDLSGSAVRDLRLLTGLDRLAVLRLGQHRLLPDLGPLRDMPGLARAAKVVRH